jgi:hypothetical protein
MDLTVVIPPFARPSSRRRNHNTWLGPGNDHVGAEVSAAPEDTCIGIGEITNFAS